MFSCHDSKQRYNDVPFEITLIEMWEKPNQIKNQWDVAVMTGIYNDDMTHDDIAFYRKDYRQSKAWKKYVKKHPEIKDYFSQEEDSPIKGKVIQTLGHPSKRKTLHNQKVQ